MTAFYFRNERLILGLSAGGVLSNELRLPVA